MRIIIEDDADVRIDCEVESVEIVDSQTPRSTVTSDKIAMVKSSDGNLYVAIGSYFANGLFKEYQIYAMTEVPTEVWSHSKCTVCGTEIEYEGCGEEAMRKVGWGIDLIRGTHKYEIACPNHERV